MAVFITFIDFFSKNEKKDLFLNVSKRTQKGKNTHTHKIIINIKDMILMFIEI